MLETIRCFDTIKKHHVVGTLRIPRYTSDRAEVIKRQIMPQQPRNSMIAARRITADADSADILAVAIEREPATEDIDSADAPAGHGIRHGAKQDRRTAISNLGVNRIAMLKPIQTQARLDLRVKISGR